jgi:hypothetical protein
MDPLRSLVKTGKDIPKTQDKYAVIICVKQRDPMD